MALKITVPERDVPTRIHGTIDGTTPVAFHATRTLWRATFGSWTHAAPAEPNRSPGDVRSFLYLAVARYRDAHRHQPA